VPVVGTGELGGSVVVLAYSDVFVGTVVVVARVVADPAPVLGGAGLVDVVVVEVPVVEEAVVEGAVVEGAVVEVVVGAVVADAVLEAGRAVVEDGDTLPVGVTGAALALAGVFSASVVGGSVVGAATGPEGADVTSTVVEVVIVGTGTPGRLSPATVEELFGRSAVVDRSGVVPSDAERGGPEPDVADAARPLPGAGSWLVLARMARS